MTGTEVIILKSGARGSFEPWDADDNWDFCTLELINILSYFDMVG